MRTMEQVFSVPPLDDFLKSLKTGAGTTGLGGFPVAPNIIEFVADERFLNVQTIWHYPPHLEILRDFYEVLCPYCNPEPEEGITADEFRKLILLKYDRCPNCQATKAELLREKFIEGYREMVGGAGMRGGKTALVSYCAAYSLHHLLAWGGEGKLQEYYGLLPGQDIEFAFLAASSTQARETVWASFSKRLDYSPWFRRFFEWLAQREQDEGLPKESLFKRSKNRLDFDRWGIHFVNLSRNAATATGRTRAGVMIDELSRFDQTDSKFSADEVYDAHQASMSTLWLKNEEIIKRGEWPLFWPVMCSIGAPYRRKDKIMTLIEEDAKKSSKMFTFRKPTWQMNPDYSRDSDFIQEKYRRDPVAAERDYAANPPGAENPAFDPDKVDAAVDRNRSPILQYRIEHREVMVNGSAFPYSSIKLIHCRFDRTTKYFIHVDPGRTNHAFALAIMHREPHNRSWRYILNASVSIKPRRERIGNRTLVWEVNFQSVLEFILELAKRINISLISFDRWQPGSFLDGLRQKGISAAQYSVTREAYMDLRRDFDEFRVVIPGSGPEGGAEALLVEELKSLNDDGVRITPTESDDSAQCLAAVHHHAKGSEMGGRNTGVARKMPTAERNFLTVPFHRRPGRFVHFGRY